MQDEALADAVERNWREAPLAPADVALCEFGESITLSPSADPVARVGRLRAAGFDDAAVLRATEIAAYFNFVNRLAEALGVELEVDGG